MSIKALVESAITQEAVPSIMEILSYCNAEQVSHESFFNYFSLELARGFHEQRYAYDDCDALMNQVFGMMTTTLFFGADINTPEPAFSIFLAFDSGEYHRPHDLSHENPVEKYTRPRVAKILKASAY